jgi:hypothetical protein
MKKDPVDIVSATLQPTERCGTLDETKKNLIIVLIGRGASRREAAAYVKCHHTTIGRAAARDEAFGAKLSQVEMAASLARNGMIHRAASEPKYWRAAAWMLERRNPEDYGKRSPNTFTADQVQSLLASVCTAALATVQPEKVAEFQAIFDDAFDEIDEKQTTRLAPREIVADRTHLAPRNAATAADNSPPHASNEHPVPIMSQNGHSHNGRAPSSNGHHPPQSPPAAETAAIDPKPPTAMPEAASAADTLAEETKSFDELDAARIGDGRFGNAQFGDLQFGGEEFDDEETSDEDLEDDFDDFDWERLDELHDAQSRYVSADVVPDPDVRREANRLVRLLLIEKRISAERLPGRPESSPTHHPLNRLVAMAGGDPSRNPLSDMDLRLQSNARTSDENTQGRCVNGLETAVCEPLPAAAAVPVDR